MYNKTLKKKIYFFSFHSIGRIYATITLSNVNLFNTIYLQLTSVIRDCDSTEQSFWMWIPQCCVDALITSQATSGSESSVTRRGERRGTNIPALSSYIVHTLPTVYTANSTACLWECLLYRYCYWSECKCKYKILCFKFVVGDVKLLSSKYCYCDYFTPDNFVMFRIIF